MHITRHRYQDPKSSLNIYSFAVCVYDSRPLYNSGRPLMIFSIDLILSFVLLYGPKLGHKVFSFRCLPSPL